MSRAITILALVLMAACATAPRAEPLVLGPFSGVLPCADCPGIQTELTLTRRGEFVAEGTYRLKQTYIDRGPPIVSTGEWTTLRGDASDEDAVVYELDPDTPEQSRHFRKEGERTIRALDREMKTWPASLPQVLTAQ